MMHGQTNIKFSPVILIANSYLSNITSLGINTAKNFRRKCVRSAAVEFSRLVIFVCLFAFH